MTGDHAHRLPGPGLRPSAQPWFVRLRDLNRAVRQQAKDPHSDVPGRW